MERQNPILNLPEHKPPRGLLGAILNRIDTLEARRAQKQFLVGVAGMAVSFVGLWYGSLYAVAELKSSAFYQYTAVLFSDADIIIAFWKDFLLAIAESFPVISAFVACSFLFLFLSSLRSLVRGSRRGVALLFTHY